ncbi:facilitated trehalose transporter Tret1-like isoform X2 [Cylas formicarius]|uniref:facilitated trehalose transporter Tret1-like isoform X2 n=1 Tax=Cylas formicarius TaxID=197179 RepID=UPI00295842BD|nr:facilitated trehalose transporter Tret1-like isoform X2 [Cylas formicarius]
MATKRQILYTSVGTLSCVSDGMQYGWTAPVIPKLLSVDSPIVVTKDQAEWLETILMLGACCGLPLTMFLVDKIGRKGSLLASASTTLVAWIIIALAPSVEYIYFARFIAGMAGDTAFVAAPMYIAEMADQKIRGFLSSIIYLMMLTGVLLIYCVAPFVPIYVPCIIGVCLNTITLVSFPFMPDSPYYLLYKNRPEEAKKSLERLRPCGDVDAEIKDIAAAVERQKEEKGRPQDLVLVKSNRRALIIMVWLNGSQHMSSISVMLMNMHSILEEAGAVHISSSTAAIIFSAIMFCAAMSASLAIDNFGRRVLLVTSGILAGTSLGVVAVYFTLKNNGVDVLHVSWVPAMAVMCYAAAFKFGIGLVPIVLTAELFPAKVKAMGMTISDACYVGFSVISLQIYHQLKNRFGIQVPFYIFAVWCFCTVAFTIAFIPETKGKTLEEIQFILKGEDKGVKGTAQSNSEAYKNEGFEP